MRVVDIIEKKRDGKELTCKEISFIINGYVTGEIPDYQMSALLMAIYFNGLNDSETLTLVEEMLESGDVVDLSSIEGIKLDKHSTGGVGDKTSLVVGPIVASCGFKLAKMSGRGLGHTGGTIDKLESIDGFDVTMSEEEFFRQVNEIGIAIVGQTKNLVPADKLLYALRDVTATVSSIPLIAASIMSKKLASGAEKIVLDVKVGSGAFMETIDEATKLAETMVKIGKGFNREVVALITNMDEPLGYAVGNALEIKEAIETLKGNGPSDFTKLCNEIAAELLKLAGVKQPEEMIDNVISSGKALNKFYDFVSAQKGDVLQIKNDKLPKASLIIEYKASSDGYVSRIDATEIGKAAMIIGAGRASKDDSIDPSVGIIMKKKVSNKVSIGDVILEIHTNNEIEGLDEILGNAITISKKSPKVIPTIIKKVS